jgi:hypothetical protein
LAEDQAALIILIEEAQNIGGQSGDAGGTKGAFVAV